MNLKKLTPSRVARSVRRRLTNRVFPINALRGVYATFDAATAAAPPIKVIGYDGADSANWYQEKFSEVWLEDYPAMFWLERAFAAGTRVFEIGGHVGEAFYAYRQFVEYPEALQWTILDVPTIAADGARIAAERGAENLRFISEMRDVPEADVVFAAGALQYFEQPVLADSIRAMAAPPDWVIVNSTPMHDGEPYITLQNIGSAYCPYRIFNREELIASITTLGYELVHSWQKDRKVVIPGHPDKCFDHYSGLVFSRSGRSSAPGDASG